MVWLMWLGGVLAGGLLLYLLVVLVKPEWF